MKKQSGFTLVEMMVAMAVALVALAATVAAFRDSAYTNRLRRGCSPFREVEHG